MSEAHHPVTSEKHRLVTSEEHLLVKSEAHHPVTSEEHHPASEEHHPASEEYHPVMSEEHHPVKSEAHHPASEEHHPASLQRQKKAANIFAKSKVRTFLYLSVIMNRFVCASSAANPSVGVPIFSSPRFLFLRFLEPVEGPSIVV